MFDDSHVIGSDVNQDTQHPSVNHLCRMLNTCYTQHIAKRVITSEVLRHELRWVNSKTGKVAHDVQVEPQWNHFVAAAIDSVLLTGCFSWRMHRKRCVIADVRDVTVVYCDTTHKYKSVVVGKQREPVRWKAEVIYPPPSRQRKGAVATITNPMTVGVAIVNENAPCYQAFALSTRQAHLERNWDARDSANSRHSGYTTVTNEMRSSHGSMKPWFRDASKTGSLTDFDTNFDTLVSNRADAIRLVGENTQKSQTVATHPFATQDVQIAENTHEEHTVTDGRNFVESATLTSSVDQANATDRIQTMIFFAMGVPPQVMGKNINSERLASSNRLSEMAIYGFQQSCADLRTRIGNIIKMASRLNYDKETDASSAQIVFAHCLTPHELSEALPFLKAKYAEVFVQCAHNLPPGSVDIQNVIAVQEGLTSRSKEGTRSEKRAGEPQSASDADAAHKRAKAAKPGGDGVRSV